MPVAHELHALALNLHRRAIVVDTHCDTTQRLMQPGWKIRERHSDWHVDIPRMQEGGVSAVFLAIWASGPMELGAGPKVAFAQFDRIHQCISENSDALSFARTAAEIRRAKSSGRIAVLIGVEGGYLIDDSLDVLREFSRQGAVYMTLTHGFHTNWADSSGIHAPLEPRHGGLSDFGREVIHEMNRIGMIVDVSHASDDTVRDVLEVSTAPVMASHSSCRAVSPHRRNLSDELMNAIASRGGLIQMNFSAAFIDPDFPEVDPHAMENWWKNEMKTPPPIAHDTPLARLVDHFDHAMQLVGPTHVGIGSDFDGVAFLPRDMTDCSMLPRLTESLLDCGYDESEVECVLGKNVLSLMDKVQIGPTNGNASPTFKRGTKGGTSQHLIAKSSNQSGVRKFVLASGSPRRAQLLRDAGFIFDVMASPHDEPTDLPAHMTPTEQAEFLSQFKAESVAKYAPDRLILAADTIAALGDRIFGKPLDRADAERILRTLCGTTHVVITAVTLLDAAAGSRKTIHDITHVTMRQISDSRLDDYLDGEAWRGKAGAYGIQDHDDPFVEHIEGSFTNVMGLPMEKVWELLTFRFDAD